MLSAATACIILSATSIFLRNCDGSPPGGTSYSGPSSFASRYTARTWYGVFMGRYTTCCFTVSRPVETSTMFSPGLSSTAPAYRPSAAGKRTTDFQSRPISTSFASVAPLTRRSGYRTVSPGSTLATVRSTGRTARRGKSREASISTVHPFLSLRREEGAGDGESGTP